MSGRGNNNECGTASFTVQYTVVGLECTLFRIDRQEVAEEAASPSSDVCVI